MDNSLSVILPVHNAQGTLQSQLQQLLEVLPELTNRFEVLIIDDGSSDATYELGQELATLYPQVSYLRHSKQQGLSAALRNGISQTSGELILVHDPQGGVDANELPKLWRRRHESTGIISSTRRKLAPEKNSWFRRWLPAHSQEMLRPSSARMRSGGFHLLQRRTLNQLPTTVSPAQSSRPATNSAIGVRTDRGPQEMTAPRPNFLQKLRDFAINE